MSEKEPSPASVPSAAAAPAPASPSLRSRLPSVFQAFMACCAAFEVPPIYTLCTGRGSVVDVSVWFDRRPIHTENPALNYLYMAVLAVLCTTRLLLCYRPELAMLVLYGAAVHWLEVGFFVVLVGAKQDWGPDEQRGGRDPKAEACLLMAVIVGNALLLTFRFFTLQSSLQRRRSEDAEERQRQLAEIRRRRAAYKQKKMLAEKNK